GYETKILTFREIMKVPKRADMLLKQFSSKYDDFISNRMFSKIKAYLPELIIVTYRHVNPMLIGRLKKELPSRPIVIQINVDQLSTLRNQQVLASDYDYYFTKDPYMVQFMRSKAGLNAFYLPEAHNKNIHVKPNINKKELEEKIDIDVLVFGNIYPYRARIVQHLISKGIKVKLFGKRGTYFPNYLNSYFQNLFITGDKKSEFLYGAKIVFNNFHYAEIESANCKYFEINGIGAFQICDYKPTLKEYSSVDPERYTYKNIEEAVAKTNYFLKNPKERYAIAEEHYQFAIKHNTYQKRIEKIFSTIGFQ
ncbi:MAG: glycosyltransferase, partial [Bacteroidota bacterium]